MPQQTSNSFFESEAVDLKTVLENGLPAGENNRNEIQQKSYKTLCRYIVGIGPYPSPSFDYSNGQVLGFEIFYRLFIFLHVLFHYISASVKEQRAYHALTNATKRTVRTRILFKLIFQNQHLAVHSTYLSSELGKLCLLCWIRSNGGFEMLDKIQSGQSFRVLLQQPNYLCFGYKRLCRIIDQQSSCAQRVLQKHTSLSLLSTCITC